MTPVQLAHSAVAAARVPFIAANDAAGLQRAATALGFQSVGTNQYVHPTDQSWVVLNGQRLERGVGQIHFRGVPPDLSQLQPLPLGQGAGVAAAQIPVSTNHTAVISQLTSAGFSETVKNFFVHPDGSWVAFPPDLGMLRGHGQATLHPQEGAQAQQAAPAPAPARGRGNANAANNAPTVAQVAGFAQKNATFEDGFLMAAMPGRLNPAGLAQERAGIVALGFKEVSPGFFQHPGDNSWVAYTGQTIERGVNQQRFARVPVNPTRMPQVAPPANAFLLAVAAAPLAKLTFAQVQKSDQALLDAGFKNLGNHVYQHGDGSFIAFTPAQVYTGQSGQIFTARPQPLDMKNAQASRPEHGFLAIAQTDKLAADTPNLGQVLGGLGFQSRQANALYEHADGSWVALQNGALFRGIGPLILKDVPKPPPPGTVIRDTSKPPLPHASSWAHWQQNFAIGKLPLLSSAQNDGPTLVNLGFIQLAPNEYWHPDGSWVHFGKSPPLGWKGYHLGQLPYNNRRPNP